MKTTCLMLILAVATLVRADVVLDWNEVALVTIRRSSTPPPVASRALAMVHVAIYDAVNSLEFTHSSFRVYAPDSSDTSREAAAAQAAFRVLVYLYPDERVQLERSLADSLALIPDGSAKSAGIRLGEVVAGRIIAWRKDDGSQTFYTYIPGARPGDWRPTPPGFKPALLPQWPSVVPFGIPSASQFRPAFPPPLDSAEYARHVQEVQTLGASNSSVRSAEQTEIAHFWADGADTVTPPGHWNRIAQTVARTANHSVYENARLFALLNVALADAAIVCWDTKFTCNLWRPITAIQQGDADSNEQTAPDPAWLPLLDTPPFPSCTSGHSTFSGAAAQVLALFFGRDEMRFTDTSELGRGSRRYSSFTQAADEAGRSRVYGGIHFEFDNQAGLQSGRAVGRYIFDHYLQRLPTSAANSLATRETFRLAPSSERFSLGRPTTSTTQFPANVNSSFAYPVTTSFSSSSSPTTLYYHYLPAPTYVIPAEVYAGDSIIVPGIPAPVFSYELIVGEYAPTLELPQFALPD